ncbi:unnamed protein product [Clonostachys rosea]|uniref:Xylanolytic transcriptional activator regulatory domain-containing protein n=1 Tax=Bionectria ochroleuca TaxID=29856 RepID=A0ABY6U5A6_BIOOC|nr:unnamed protein product [Clonostachys rosea]
MRRLAGLSKEDLLKKVEALEEQLAATDTGRQDQNWGEPSSERRQSTFSTVSDQHAPSSLSTNTPSDQRVDGDHDFPSVFSPPSPGPVSLCPSLETAEALRNFAHEAHNTPNERSRSPIHVTEEEGLPLLETYLESLHRRVPFCDYTELLTTLKTQPPPSTSRMGLYRLYMACTIGATIKALTGTSRSLNPDRYLQRALKVKESLDESDLIAQTEAVFWMVLYKLRFSFSSNVWYLIGLAMRTAVDADLHREYHYQELNPPEAERQRRLFWSVYTIERNICWSLQRPFSLSDLDIDTQMPSIGTVFECIQACSGQHGQCPHLGCDDGPTRPLDFRVFIASVQLARIKSKSHSQLFRVDQPIAPHEHLPTLLQKIHEFEASLPECNGQDREFLQLHVQNAIRVLIEPYLYKMDSSDPLLRTCLEACGGLCQIFKRMRQGRELGYSFTMVNSVFVAGTTICFIVFRNPNLWTPATANNLRACSSTLFAAAERNNSLKKYCDVLETIIETVMDHVAQATSPHPTVDDAAASVLKGQSTQAAFDKLKRTFKEMKFEFPSHSYPRYAAGSTNVQMGALASPQSAIEHSEELLSRETPGIAQWTSPDTTNEALDVASMGFLFYGEGLGQPGFDHILMP